MSKRNFVTYNPSDGYVFYKDIPEGFSPLSHAHWEAVRGRGLDYYSNMSRSLSRGELKKIAVTLKTQAEVEYEKERKTLEDFFGIKVEKWGGKKADMRNMIKAINTAFNLKDAYNRMVDTVRSIAPKSISRMTPASYFGQNFAPDVVTIITEYCRANLDKILEGSLSGQELELRLKEAAANSMVDTLERNYGKEGEDKSFFSAAAEVLKKDKELKKLLGQDAFSRYGFPKLLAKLEKDYMGKNVTEELIEDLVSRLNVKTDLKFLNAQTTAGIMQEYVENAVGQALMQMFKVQGLSFMPGRKTIADITRIFAKERKGDHVNATIQSQFDEKIIRGREDFIKEVQRIQKEISKNVEESVIVYENVKKYHLGTLEKREGFLGSKFTDIDTFGKTLENIGVPNAQKMMDYLKNTMPGAIYEGQTKQVSQTIAQHVALFLFDDFHVEGTARGDGAIHLLRLSNIVVPLSYLLDTFARALTSIVANPDNVVNIVIAHDKSILYPASQYPMTGKGIGPLSATPEGSIARWNKQRGSSGVSIALRFLKNFNVLIKKDFALI